MTLGAQSAVLPGVRIYPYKEVETGAQIHESVIWEARTAPKLFGKDGVSGLVNVDLTPETAVRLAAALGTALKRGARVVASRESPDACRMIKRAMISGLNSTGVDIADLRVLPASVSRHLLKTQGYDAGFHVGVSYSDPEMLEIRFYEQPGSCSRPACRRRSRSTSRATSCGAVGLQRRRGGELSRPGPGRATPRTSSRAWTWRRSVRAVSDRRRLRLFRHLLVLPLLLGPLGIEAVSAHGFAADSSAPSTSLREAVARASGS